MSVMGVSCSCFSSCVVLGGALEVEKLSSSSAQFFIIMKKILLFFVALLCSFAAAMAQVNYVATLQHGDAITNFYGGGAFEQAYNASEDGDVITLSAGTFSFGTCDFKKGITVRGTGIEAAEKTFISSRISFFSGVETKVANIEGIVFNSFVYINNDANETSHGKINFIKNRFTSSFITQKSGTPAENGPAVRVYNSIVSSISFYEGSNPNVNFYNCFVSRPSSNLKSPTISSFVNCVLCYYSWGSSDDANYLNYLNCIFDCTQQNSGWYAPWNILSGLATVRNCISINCGNFFNNVISGGNNQNVSSLTDVFKGFTGVYEADETFELTDEAAKTYLGTDGTQVGMQGGVYPYNTTVQYPIITKFESVPQTTKEGMLSIDVQVDGK